MQQAFQRVLFLVLFSVSAFAHEGDFHFPLVDEASPEFSSEEAPWYEDDAEFLNPEEGIQALACTRANSRQIASVIEGNGKKDAFLRYCSSVTGGSAWCHQLIRPNPSSISSFRCTYGNDLVHQLIHPDQNTWTYAAQAVRLVEKLEGMGIRICQIYNWWRPEPYNKNVGGAAGRHPNGTSVDVRFCSKGDQEKAHVQLCAWRKKGQLRALGYYGGTALHFGVGDANANTWGKSCN